VPVGVLVGVPVGVLVGVPVGVPVGVLVGVPVGVLVGVPVGVLVGVPVGVPVGVSVGVPVGVVVGISANSPGVTVGAKKLLPTPTVSAPLSGVTSSAVASNFGNAGPPDKTTGGPAAGASSSTVGSKSPSSKACLISSTSPVISDRSPGTSSLKRSWSIATSEFRPKSSWV
jgi:F-box/WD-40 domain protein 10